jgi:nicotinate-nucleotide pyrophosphorylase (carboxylating)
VNPLFSSPEILNFIDRCLAEDIGDGDHSANACIPLSAKGQSRMLIKESGIIAGLELAEVVFHRVDPTLQITHLIKDGTPVEPGDVAFTVTGSARNILTAERLVLNLCQRLSGVATSTQRYVQELQGLHTKVLDTRKTTPGMRLLEKWAVKTGGGENHRIGLYDMIMIKDNHADFCGGLEAAIDQVHAYLANHGLKLRIEVETRNLNEVERTLAKGGIHRIMLDNFDIPTLRKAVKLINGAYETEASGGITMSTLRAYAETGVDYISVGALTHSVKSLDISLKAV